MYGGWGLCGRCAALDAAAGGHACGVGCGGGHSYAFRRRSVPDIGITSGN